MNFDQKTTILILYHTTISINVLEHIYKKTDLSKQQSVIINV